MLQRKPWVVVLELAVEHNLTILAGQRQEGSLGSLWLCLYGPMADG
jgi:hypothetical protein